jgi:hypothetical protein
MEGLRGLLLSPPYLQFVDQDGDGVELIGGGVRRVSHGGRLVERERARLWQGNRESRFAVVVFGEKQGGIFGQALGRAAGIACGAGCDAMGKWVLADRASLTNEWEVSQSGQQPPFDGGARFFSLLLPPLVVGK